MANMSERIGIELYVKDEGATDKLKGFERELKNVEREIASVRQTITSLRGRQVSLLDERATLRSLSKVEAEIKRVERQMTDIRNKGISAKGFSTTFKQYKELEATLRRLTGEKRTILINTSQLEEVRSQLRHAQQTLRELTDRKRGLKMDASDAKKAQAAVDAITAAERRLQEENARTGSSFARTFDSVQSKLRFVGSSFQTLGRTFQNLTSIGGRLFTGILWGLGNRAIGLMSEGLSNALTRSDTMRTYEATLKAAGFDDVDKPFERFYNSPFADKTQGTLTGKEQLNEAVLGLPTSLDEIMRAQRTYATAAGDYRKSVGVAIAANNAWIANVTEGTKKNVAERQLRNILSGADLTGKQIDALRTAMPATWRNIEKYLQEQGKLKGALAAELGKSVSYDEFIEAFIREGTHGKTADAVTKMIHTYGSAITNIKTAFTRMGANILDTLGNTLKGATGKDLIDYLGDVKDFIDKISESIQNWIRKNPEKIVAIIDAIKSVDWMGILRGLAQGLQGIGRLILKVINFFGKFGSSGAEVFGKLLIYGNAFGKLLTIMGGLMRGGAPIIALIFAGVKKIAAATAGGKIGGFVGKIAGLFKKLGSIGKGAKAAEAGAEAIGKTGEAMQRSATSWASVGKTLAVGGVILAIGATIKLIASAMKDLNGIDINWRKMGKSMAQMALLFGEFAGLAVAIGALLMSPVIGWLTTASLAAGGVAITGIAGIILIMTKALRSISETKIPSDAKVKAVARSVKKFVPIINDIVDALNESGESARELKKDAKKAKRYAEIVDAINNITQSLVQLAETKIDQKMIDKALENVKGVADVVAQVNEQVMKLFVEETDLSNNNPMVGVDEITKKYFDLNKTKKYAEMTTNISTILQNFTGILTQFGAFTDEVRRLVGNKVISANGTDLGFGMIKGRITAIADFLYYLVYSEDGSTLSPLIKLKNAGNQLKKANIDNITDALLEVRRIIIQMDALTGYLKKWYGEGKGKRREGFKNALDAVAEMLAEIRNMFADGWGDRSWEGFVTNATNLDAAMAKLHHGVVILTNINTRLGGEAITGVDTNLNTLLSNVAKALVDAPTLLAEATIFSTAAIAFGSAVDLLTGIAGEGLDDIPRQLDDIRSALNRLSRAFSGIGRTWHDQVINGFNASDVKWQIVLALASLPYSISTSGFYDVGLTMGTQIKSGFEAGMANLRIPYQSYSQVQSGISNLVNSVQYRSGGGSIFRRRGSDTVPAMLTPGEFVQNRRAVKAFGTSFMQRINALDLPGAMRALSLRTGKNIATYAGGTVVNNNNQSVTINTKNTGSEYTYRRANRFVRGLT